MQVDLLEAMSEELWEEVGKVKPIMAKAQDCILKVLARGQRV